MLRQDDTISLGPRHVERPFMTWDHAGALWDGALMVPQQDEVLIPDT